MYGGYLALRDEARDQRIISRLTDDELHVFGYCPLEPSRQVVEHDHALAAFDNGMDHVAADVPGAAGNQDCHGLARAAFQVVLNWSASIFNLSSPFGGGIQRPTGRRDGQCKSRPPTARVC